MVFLIIKSEDTKYLYSLYSAVEYEDGYFARNERLATSDDINVLQNFIQIIQKRLEAS